MHRAAEQLRVAARQGGVQPVGELDYSGERAQAPLKHDWQRQMPSRFPCVLPVSGPSVRQPLWRDSCPGSRAEWVAHLDKDSGKYFYQGKRMRYLMLTQGRRPDTRLEELPPRVHAPVFVT